MRRVLPFSLVAGLTATALAQSPPIEDVLWTATLTDLRAVDHFGRTTRSVPAASVHALGRSPDGTLWTLVGTSVQRRARDGALVNSRPAATGGTPLDLAIDAAGNAWVIERSTTDGVVRYDAQLVARATFGLLSVPRDIAITADGAVWVLQANQPGALVTRIDPATGVVANFTLPSSLGAGVALVTTANGSVLVGCAVRIAEVNALGLVTRVIDGVGGSLQAFTATATGELFVLSLTSASLDLRRIDPRTGVSIVIASGGPTSGFGPTQIALDHTGGLWTSGWPAGPFGLTRELRRIDVEQHRFDLRLGFAAGIEHGSGYHRALVVAPHADDDGDGTTNRSELQIGTNPYDAQSNAAVALRTERITYRQLDPIVFDLHAPPGPAALLFALDTRYGQAPLPGLIGSLRLEPSLTIPFVQPLFAPGSVAITVPANPSLDGDRVYAQAVAGAFPTRLTNEVGVLIAQPQPTVVVETFDDAQQLDRERSAGSWTGGVAEGGLIGGAGTLGDFDHRHGQDLGSGVWLWSTDDQLIPASTTLDGVARRVTDGRFDFATFHVPPGITVRFRGTHPAVLRVAGVCRIDGRLDLGGELVPGTHDGKNSTVAGSTIQPGPGQPGGEPGPGGGHGGDGAWGCDGSGNPNQAQFNGFNGYDGEDVQVPAGHAYAGNVSGTGGRGAQLFPAHGDQARLVLGALAIGGYAVETAAGAGGGGYIRAGGNGVATYAGSITGFGPPATPNTTPAHRGPPTPGGLQFPLLQFPASVVSSAYFLVGGSGGGGGASHPTLATQREPTKFRSGGAGAGGGGAIMIRAGADLEIGSGGRIEARGGSCEPAATASTQGARGVPAPGGGGSGGSVLLQVGGTVSQLGAIDVRGGGGSKVRFAGFFVLDTEGGDGADGYLRLEVPDPNPSLALLGTTFPSATQGNVDTLRERDPVTTQLSRRYDVPSDQTLVFYELDVRIGGVVHTFTDDPARFAPANQLGQPVRIRFQGFDDTGEPGPWRDFVSARAPGGPGLADDFPAEFRFQLIFDGSAQNVTVEELRVIAR